MKFRKKPIVIEAFKFYVDDMPNWFMNAVTENEVELHCCDYKKYSIDEAHCRIKTPEGDMTGNGGDYIIQGVNKEIYPCKEDIFLKTYEKV